MVSTVVAMALVVVSAQADERISDGNCTRAEYRWTLLVAVSI